MLQGRAQVKRYNKLNEGINEGKWGRKSKVEQWRINERKGIIRGTYEKGYIVVHVLSMRIWENNKGMGFVMIMRWSWSVMRGSWRTLGSHSESQYGQEGTMRYHEFVRVMMGIVASCGNLEWRWLVFITENTIWSIVSISGWSEGEQWTIETCDNHNPLLIT